MDISQFQKLISDKYETHDRRRGVPATFMWFVEEVGELATALAGKSKADKAEELVGVFAWLCTLANISDVDLDDACQKYSKEGIKEFES